MPRTQERLQTAINTSTLDTPDTSTRKKIIDFEYDNFNTMLHDLPLDVELKYPGVPFFDPEIVLPKVQSLFKTGLLYFKKAEQIHNTNTTINDNRNNNNRPVTNALPKAAESSSGCLGLIVFFIVTSVLIACSM